MSTTADRTATVHAGRTFTLEGGLPRSLVIGLAGVLVIEGAVLHLWIASRSAAWAWAVTAINVATLVWLWREHKPGMRSTLAIDEREVEIALGNRLRCRFARSSIARAERATWQSVPDMAPADYLNTAKPLEPNILIVLEQPVEARLSLGLRKRYARIGVRVQDTESVLAALRATIASDQTRS